MCDTLIATKLASADGIAIFAKNSDRPPNEGQYLLQVPAAQHDASERLKCTYIEIPQVKQTYAVLLSKPFWMWGAEMGVNEHGVVIGNEAIFSKVPANKKPALLGMDLLRLGLERAAAAREALNAIIELLEQFGQGGNCTYDHETYYHNSFLIADPGDAWVLETVDKQWAARQVKDVYSISNCLTIQNQWDLASDDLKARARKMDEGKSPPTFNFAKDYSDFLYTTFGKGPVRRATSYGILEKGKGAVTVQTMMNTLRNHGEHADQTWDPQKSFTEVDVCMHAGFGPIRISQSTASLVVYLDKKRPTVFATGTSAPCTSVLKPVWVDVSLLGMKATPTQRYDPQSLFWSHEHLHRATLLNYPERLQSYAPERDTLEQKFIQGSLECANASPEERAAYSAQCFREAAAAEADWLGRVEKVPARKTGGWFYAGAWDKLNKEANMPAIR